MAPRFSKYREWLASDEYKAQIARLIAAPNDEPRTDWPVDLATLAAQHEAHATMCLEAAARHMRKAKELIEAP